VAKDVVKGRTETAVRPLSDPERVAEIARLLAGDRVTATTLKQARELLRATSGGAVEEDEPGGRRTTPPSAAGAGKARRGRSA